MDINTCAVLGTVRIGTGFTGLKQFAYNLNMPGMNERTYIKRQSSLCNTLYDIGVNEMQEAAEQEKAEAIKIGSVDKNCVPLIAVIVDGSYVQRGTRTNVAGSYKGRVSATVISHNTGALDKFKDKVTTMKNDVDEAKKRVSDLEMDKETLMAEVNDLKNEAKKNNMVVFGLPEVDTADGVINLRIVQVKKIKSLEMQTKALDLSIKEYHRKQTKEILNNNLSSQMHSNKRKIYNTRRQQSSMNRCGEGGGKEEKGGKRKWW
ncbi:hypothetical protein B566_EDAN016014, partial [Ephemera danica]